MLRDSWFLCLGNLVSRDVLQHRIRRSPSELLTGQSMVRQAESNRRAQGGMRCVGACPCHARCRHVVWLGHARCRYCSRVFFLHVVATSSPKPYDSAHMVSQTPVRATWSGRSATVLRTAYVARAYVLAYALAESHLTISEHGEA